MAQSEAAIKVANDGLSAMNKAMALTTSLAADKIPWKVLKETMQALNENQDQYSHDAATLVGEIAKALLDSHDQYVASVNIMDACGARKPSA